MAASLSPEPEGEIPRVIPAHDLPIKQPPELTRWVTREMLRRLENWARRMVPSKIREMAERGEVPNLDDENVSEARGIPFEVAESGVPIFEIAVTGAAASAIMALEAALGGRAERYVQRVLSHGTLGGVSRAVLRPGGGGLQKFNAAKRLDELMEVSARRDREELRVQGGDGSFFPGILG